MAFLHYKSRLKIPFQKGIITTNSFHSKPNSKSAMIALPNSAKTTTRALKFLKTNHHIVAPSQSKIFIAVHHSRAEVP